MQATGPIFAIAPAPIVQQVCPVTGSVFMIATSGIILAVEGQALALRLDPTAMIAIGTVLQRAGAALGGDATAALEQLAALPAGDIVAAGAMRAEPEAEREHAH